MSDRFDLSPQEIFLLAKNSLMTFVVISLFEVAKGLFFSNIDLLSSHLITIFFITFSFILFFNNFLHHVAQEKEIVKKESNKFENNYLSLIDNIPLTTFRTVANSEGKILNVNSVGLKMFDLSDININSIKIRDLYKDPKKADELVARILKYGIVKNEEIEFKTPKGRIFWGQISTLAKKDENNQTYLEGYISDISDLKSVQEKLEIATRELEKTNLPTSKGNHV